MNFPLYEDCPYICIDLETYDPGLTDLGASWARNDLGFITGAAVGAVGVKSQYYACRHDEGNNLTEENFFKYMLDLKNTGKPILAFNWPYEAGWLTHKGVDIGDNPVLDPLSAEIVIDNSHQLYNLDALAKFRLGRGKVDEGLERYAKEHKFKAKDNMHHIPASIAGVYACGDVDLEVGLYENQKDLLTAHSLWEAFNLECAVLPLLPKMKRRGVPVDLEKLHLLKKEFHNEEKSLELAVSRESGFYSKINVWSGASLARLFDKLKIPYGLTGEGNPSFTSNFLEGCSHPIAAKILRIKRLNKLRNTFLAGLERLQVNGRVHPDYHAGRSEDGGTISGRFSCSNPNDQQAPSRTEEGLRVREVYIPENKYRWGNFDYKQQEPRLSIHYASKLRVEGIEYWVDTYTKQPDTDFYTFILNLCGIPRQDSKTITLALEYGMGKELLANRLHKSVESAEVDIKKFHAHVPWMKPLMNACASKMVARGWIKSYFGRRFMAVAGKDYIALNRLVQGTGGEQIKKAMVDVYRELGIFPYSTIHDELNYPIMEDMAQEQATAIKEIMRDAIQLAIPVGVDAGVDRNWAFAKKHPELVV